MDPVETERRLSRKIHLALVAALAGYCFLFAQSRGRISSIPPDSVQRVDLFLPMVVLAVVQFAAISVIARKRLRSNLGQPGAGARLYFFLRAVSAEAIALFGLLIGFLGAPVLEVAALFALSLAAMLSSFPTREAWQNALRTAGTRDP